MIFLVLIGTMIFAIITFISAGLFKFVRIVSRFKMGLKINKVQVII